LRTSIRCICRRSNHRACGIDAEWSAIEWVVATLNGLLMGKDVQVELLAGRSRVR
jgi:hypothetical protein